MDDNENKDLLDLCNLNILEERAEISCAPDAKDALTVIEWRKRRLTANIRPGELAPDAMKRHIEENTVDGVYPWTDAMPKVVEEEE